MVYRESERQEEKQYERDHMNRKTLLKQLKHQNPLWKNQYNVKEVMDKGKGKGLRLHTKQKDGTVVNIDITLNPMDYYTLKFHELKGEFSTKVETTEKGNISFDKLNETIKNQLEEIRTERKSRIRANKRILREQFGSHM